MKNQPKIKVCHIQLLPLMSGVQRSMLDIFSQLDRKLYDITVICKDKGDLTAELDRVGIRYLLINQLERDIRPIRDLAAFFRFLAIFHKFKFDLIHTHSSKTGFIGRFAAFLSGCPVIFHTVHGFPFHEFSGKIKTLVYSFLERLGALVSTRVIFVNNEEREFAVKHHLVPKHKAVTVYNGVNQKNVQQFLDGAYRADIRRKWNVGSRRLVVGFVGRLWEQKDPETLYRTIQACRDLPVTFVILGDGPYRHLFEEPSLNVILEGWVQKPMEYYPAIDILIQPSLWEGLSMTLIEAMVFGKPSVASDIKGNRECITHGENGFLCAPRNVFAFKQAIEMLVTNPGLYDRMSKEAKLISSLKFDVGKNFTKIVSMYKDSIKGSRHGKNI